MFYSWDKDNFTLNFPQNRRIFLGARDQAVSSAHANLIFCD